MNNNAEKDTKKSLDRLSTSSSTISSHTFDMVDKAARKLSDFKVNYLDDKKEDEESNSQLSTSNENSNNTQYESRLKTNEIEKDEEIEQNTLGESTSRLHTNINMAKDSISTDSTAKNKNDSPNRIKTAISKTTDKVFKFSENQGKFSKATTIVSKTGSKVSKLGRKVTRTSRELNKMMSNDGTGKDYFQDKIGRTTKKIVSKPIKKGAKKLKNKLGSTLGKKLIQVSKTLLLKLIKILISVFVSLVEIMIPLCLVIIFLFALGSIFGSSSSDKGLLDYKQYMNSVQEEYNRKVDDWLTENPEGEVIGVAGNYGRIDWRIPLAILQLTEAELSFDQSEKKLLEKFKEANLFEKHEITEQIVEKKDDAGNIVEDTIPVLIITNGMYDDYMEWCQRNYSLIANFNKEKKVTDGSDTWFSNEQLELMEMLHQSSDYAELLGITFQTHTPSHGKTKTVADLNSEYYNSKNVLTASGFKGQCTWYSHGRALELFNMVLPSGNAQTWLKSAVSGGLKTGTQPSYNSVVVLASKNFGHVAFVESYDGKSITISEGNVGNPCSNSDSCSAVEYANQHANELVRTKTYSSFSEYRRVNKNNGYTIIGFIYLD